MAKYADRIAKSKDEKEASKLTLEAKNASLRVQKAELDAEAAVELAKNDLELVAEAIPFDIEDYIEAKRAVKEAEEDLADIKGIKEDLF